MPCSVQWVSTVSIYLANGSSLLAVKFQPHEAPLLEMFDGAALMKKVM